MERPNLPAPAKTSSRDIAATGFPNTSLHAFTVVSPTRTPVNEPGPVATANRSTSSKLTSAAFSSPSTTGSSHDEYSAVAGWDVIPTTVPARSSATLPFASHVSIASTSIYGDSILHSAAICQHRDSCIRTRQPFEPEVRAGPQRTAIKVPNCQLIFANCLIPLDIP